MTGNQLHPGKREKTLLERGLDFSDAADVFEGRTYDREDDRFDYGEVRLITAGYLGGRMVIVVWTQRGGRPPCDLDEESQ